MTKLNLKFNRETRVVLVREKKQGKRIIKYTKRKFISAIDGEGTKNRLSNLVGRVENDVTSVNNIIRIYHGKSRGNSLQDSIVSNLIRAKYTIVFRQRIIIESKKKL